AYGQREQERVPEQLAYAYLVLSRLEVGYVLVQVVPEAYAQGPEERRHRVRDRVDAVRARYQQPGYGDEGYPVYQHRGDLRDGNERGDVRAPDAELDRALKGVLTVVV